MNKKKSLCIAVICMAMLSILTGCGDSTNSDYFNIDISTQSVSQDELIKDFKLTIATFAKQYCEQQLVSPSTAKFPWDAPTIISAPSEKEGYTKYILESYVDSQNNFGAMIRSYYRFTIETDDATMSDFYNLSFEFLE